MIEGFVLNDKKIINGWALFDWANSAYFLVIATAVFPIYYRSVTADTISIFGLELLNETLYSYAVSFSYILIAILSPMLAGMADYGGRRKYFLKLFTWLGALACCSLFWFQSEEGVWLGTVGYVVATIGAAGGIVFYNAYLPLIASEDRYDQVSAKGYAYGYIGSVLLLIFCLLLIQKPLWFGLEDGTLPSRIGFLLVGLWWLGFAQITFRRLPPDHPIVDPENWFARGIKEVKSVWRYVRNAPNIRRYLVAFFFYSAGVQTVIYLATIFADEELTLSAGQLILTILIIQMVAIIGAYIFAWVSKIRGNKYALLFQIVIWFLICLGAYFVANALQFYILAALVGMVLGGIQSLSRSTYTKLLDDEIEDLTSFFSFYDVLYKVSVVMGAFVFGLVNQLTGNMRYSVLVLGIFFLLGFLFLYGVSIEKAKINRSDE